ncbi:MAG: NAD(+) synthase [Clostridia bacterium]|nr:NAD(+) synthase [Clostridia bacterium]
MDFGFVKSGVFIPKTNICAPIKNAKNIINAITEANEKGIELLSFPELSLTGVNLNDLYFNNGLLDESLCALNEIVIATKNIKMLVVVGMPFKKDNLVYNTAVVINDGKILAVVPETNPSSISLKNKYFANFNGENEVIEILGKKVVFGTNLIFNEKTNQNFTTSISFGVKVDNLTNSNISVNLSSEPEWVGKEEYIKTCLSAFSKSNNSAVLFANAGSGETGTDLVYSGRSYIYENGKLLSENIPFNFGLIQTEIDIDYLSYKKSKAERIANKQEVVYFSANRNEQSLERKYSKTPFVPQDENEKSKRADLILDIQAEGLKNRFIRSYSKTLVMGLSGGLDSTLALLVCHRAIKKLNISTKSITAITMPCFGTTSRTLDNSITLAKALGVTLKKIDISKSVTRHLKDIKHQQGALDIAFENAQARERTQILMDVANMEGGLVVGTGDLSEVALGWSTYNGDHMSMFAVNSSLPKTLIREVVNQYAVKSRGKLKAVLLDILGTPVSPELLPPDKDTIAQKTEDIVGPYDLHDFFLYHFISRGASPKKLKYIAYHTFNGLYSKETIDKWLKKFFTRFITQQFKRSCSPEGIKTGSISLSPRGEFNMPADTLTEMWLKDL